MPTKKKKTEAPKKKYYPKPLAFTAENMEKVADKIFSVKDGAVTATVLCNGSLIAGGKEKKVVHCAVGELYHHFVSANPKRLLHLDSYEGATGAAIREIVEKSGFAAGKKRKELTKALDLLVTANDDVYDRDPDDSSVSNGICRRSEIVADKIRKTILPLFNQ